MRRPPRRASSTVSAPSPGPISTTRSRSVGATRSTMARAMPGSRRKCWPRARRLPAGTRLEIGEEGAVDLAHAGLGGPAIAGVVDHVVGERGLVAERHLVGDAPLDVGAITIAGDRPRVLGGGIGDDDD